MNGTVLEKTIRNGKGFERVSLTPAELRGVHQFVMEHNLGVVHDSLGSVDAEFPDVEPARRLQIALLIADKACLHILTAHKEALSAKVAAIKDAMNGNGGDNHD